MWSFALQLYSRRLFIYMPQMWEDYKKMEIRKNIEQCKYYTQGITLEKCKNPEKEIIEIFNKLLIKANHQQLHNMIESIQKEMINREDGIDDLEIMEDKK